MKNLIDQIIEIDSVAQGLVESANVKARNILLDAEKQLIEIKERYDNRVEKRLAKIKAEYDRVAVEEMEVVLKAQKEKISRIVNIMNANRNAWEKEILANVLGGDYD